MAQLLFQGISVDIHLTEKLTYEIIDGVLKIKCHDFTGEILLSPCSKGNIKKESNNTTTNNSANYETVGDKPVVEQKEDMHKHTPYSKEKNTNGRSDGTILHPTEGKQSAKMDEFTFESIRVSPSKSPSSKDKQPEKEPSITLHSDTSIPTTLYDDIKPIKGTTSPVLRSQTSSTKKHSKSVTLYECNLSSRIMESIVVQTGGKIPTGRWGHAGKKISRTKILIYGGEDTDGNTLGDIYVFDTVKREWSVPLNCPIRPRCWHSLERLPNKELIAFGGLVNVGDETYIEGMPLDTMVLDTANYVWYPPAITGKPPRASSGQAVGLIEKKYVVLFGGLRGRTHHNSVSILDIETRNWILSPEILGEKPKPRAYHTMTKVGDNMLIIFGGKNLSESLNTIDVLQYKNREWQWRYPRITGSIPLPRAGHAAVALGDRYLLIHGGWDPAYAENQKTDYFQDMYILDTVQWEWSAIKTKKDLPYLSGHLAITLEGSSKNTYEVYLIGGQNEKDELVNNVFRIDIVL